MFVFGARHDSLCCRRQWWGQSCRCGSFLVVNLPEVLVAFAHTCKHTQTCSLTHSQMTQTLLQPLAQTKCVTRSHTKIIRHKNTESHAHTCVNRREMWKTSSGVGQVQGWCFVKVLQHQSIKNLDATERHFYQASIWCQCIGVLGWNISFYIQWILFHKKGLGF